jgi:transposase
MSTRERQRLVCLAKVQEGSLPLWAAAAEMEVSYRQAKRLWQRYRREGDAGLVHGLRGRPSNHQGRQAERKRVLALYRQKYRDFGPTLAAEQLQKRDGLAIDHETLRRWLLTAGLWQRRRKRKAYRRWRERREHLGEMVQMDGSEHDWFEGRGPRCVLMVMIDDATNRTYARFVTAETTAAAMTVFGEYVKRYGLPQSLYVDRDSIYRTTRAATADEALAGTEACTQFGRAMQELGVELICARSPQAKGRVERRNSVFQDRLVKELRLQGICDLEAANAYLHQHFLPELNTRFTVAARAPEDWHRPLPKAVRLEEVLSFQEARVVQNDWTVRWRNRWLQITAKARSLGLAGQKVLVRERLDGSVQLIYGGHELAWQELPSRPKAEPPPPSPKQEPRNRKPWKPSADHPWRRSWKRKTPEPSETQAAVQRLIDGVASQLDARQHLRTGNHRHAPSMHMVIDTPVSQQLPTPQELLCPH